MRTFFETPLLCLILLFVSPHSFVASAFKFVPDSLSGTFPRMSQSQTDLDTTRVMPLSSSKEDGDSRYARNVLFVECGFGNDSHGQSSTKAAVRACRNAIEFNSIPSIKRLVPGGYDALKLDVILAIPKKYQDGLDLSAVAAVFPYGETRFTIQDGGMIAPSGIAIDSLGDKTEDMVVVCASVTVGY